MDALFREQRDWDVQLLRSMKYSGRVGAFEGAAYEPRGLYRPEADCIMFTRDPAGFCRVCQRAITRIMTFIQITVALQSDRPPSHCSRW